MRLYALTELRDPEAIELFLTEEHARRGARGLPAGGAGMARSSTCRGDRVLVEDGICQLRQPHLLTCSTTARTCGGERRAPGRSLVRAASPHLSLNAGSALADWTNVEIGEANGGEDVDMSYPLLPISQAASATTGAFLSATRTTCGKAAGRMDGECTLILIAVTAVQSICLKPAGCWDRQSPAKLASQAVVRSPCSI